MKKLIAIILLSSFSFIALARVVVPWSVAKMQASSDLIVIGTVIKVQDLAETNAMLRPGYNFVGVEATFAVSEILKGDATNQTVVLHYYRFDKVIPPERPSFLSFSPSDTNQYKLYLVNDGVGRFAPVSGQLDPKVDAVEIVRSRVKNVVFHGDLMTLISHHKLEKIKELVKAYPGDVNTTNYTMGMTPLGWAADQGYKDIVELLLTNNAAVNGNGNNVTPLMLAQRMGHEDVEEVLLQHGGYGSKCTTKPFVGWYSDGDIRFHLAKSLSEKSGIGFGQKPFRVKNAENA